MGFLDAITGRRKLKGPRPTGCSRSRRRQITLDTEHGITTRGAAAIVFQPLATGGFEQIAADMEAVLRGTGEETGSTIETSADTSATAG